MNVDACNEKLKLYNPAIEYIAAKLKEGKKDSDISYPLNRGDIMLLVMLIDRELPVASSYWREPFNRKRLAAIREKLGNLVPNAPEMSKIEAQQFRE